MAHHDIPGYISDDPGYGATPPGSSHEHTDANVWVIAKFGRFPSRNAALGRESRPEEREYLSKHAGW